MIQGLDAIIDHVRQNPRLIFADDYELHIRRTRKESRRFRNAEAMSLGGGEEIWIGLRVLHRRQPGRSAVSFADEGSLVDLVESAFVSSRAASADPWFKFPLWRSHASPKRAPSKPSLPARSIAADLELLPQVLDENYELAETTGMLVRKTEKQTLSYSSASLTSRTAVIHTHGDNSFSLREDRVTSVDENDRATRLRALIERALARRGGRSFRSKATMPLIVGPAVVAKLLELTQNWFSAEALHSQISPFSGKLGERVFSPVLSLIDDGTLEGGVATQLFDWEGSAMQKTLVVDKGVLKNGLHDTSTGTRENRLSTGNLVGWDSSEFPRIGATNFYLEPGEKPPESWLDLFPEAIWLDAAESIERVSGEMTRFVMTGSGWSVGSHTKTEPLWDIRFTFDLGELWRGAVSAGNDLAFFGRYGAPSILVENLPLGA